MTADSFLLGSHLPNWVGVLEDVPLFISHRRLKDRKSLPKATTRWALDSSAFSEITQYGRYTFTPDEYVASVRRYQREIGKMMFCSPMDLMCEEMALERTGLTVYEHQIRTVESVVTLRALAPECPWIPVLQGYSLRDYLVCVRLYESAGIRLQDEKLVGLGSVCRRQAESEIGEIAETLYNLGIKCHGYGVKAQGLKKYHQFLTSADSMAWSMSARRHGERPCPHSKRSPPPVSCSNCVSYALGWRQNVLASLD